MQSGHPEEGRQVFGEATAPPAQASPQIGSTDARVQAQDFGHLGDVHVIALAQLSDLVDEADLGGQESVRRVLHQLGGPRVAEDHGGVQRGVELGHPPACRLIG